jgi:hypothetical protein
VARRKKKKSGLFNIFGKGTKKKRTKKETNWRMIFSVLAVIVALSGIGVGLYYLNRYVSDVRLNKKVDSVKLLDVPGWVNRKLEEKLYRTALAGIDEAKINENTARIVQRNIDTGFHWLADPVVQVESDTVQISGDWRKPLALVKIGSKKYHIDSELVVLDFIPAPKLAIVRIRGLGGYDIPSPGNVWTRQDLSAAIDILSRLNKMDQMVTPKEPLLAEIETIDVSNFNGRENKDLAHIIMYAKDSTEIIWGAEIDSWQRNLEATDREKIGRLYHYYKEKGTLLGNVKYIDLRNLQDKIYQPIDKY